MMRVVLTVPNGDQYRLDTPDPALVGLWLKTLFDSFASTKTGQGYIPTMFTLEVS